MKIKYREIVKVLHHIFLKPTSRYLIYVINEEKTYILYEGAEDMRLRPYDKWISVLRQKLTMSLINFVLFFDEVCTDEQDSLNSTHDTRF